MATFVRGGKGLTTVLINSNTTWTCPAGVTQVILIGCGGGGGGMGGAKATVNSLAYGGYGACVTQQVVTVVPNTTYSVTIGTGGSGGAGRASTGGGNIGNSGGYTVFGFLATFPGAFGGVAPGAGGLFPFPMIPPQIHPIASYTNSTGPFSWAGDPGGNATVTSTTYYLGGLGGASGYGNVLAANGGKANNSTSGVAGQDAASTNYGAGGGAGGATNTGATSGSGGSGAGGMLYIIFSEG